jgi:glycosyltransferase involved in cell wall biosynthesis
MTRTVVHYIDTSEFAGAERAMLTLMTGLDRSRWSPLLFHPDAPGLRPLVERARDAGIETRVVPAARGLRGARVIPRFRRAVREVRPDVFHAHLNWPLACSAGLLAASWAGVPAIVATAHLVSDLPRSVTIPLQRRVVTRVVDRYIAVSRHAARALEHVLHVPATRITTVHNGVASMSEEHPRTPRSASGGPTRAVVVTLARLTAQKGIDVLLRAAPALPEVSFVIAGDGPERHALEAQAKALGIADRVEFLGFQRDPAALLARSDLFVLPSLEEGLPLALLEAMEVGTPLVATAIGGTDEVVTHGEHGLLVPAGDAVALASAIGTLLRDPAFAARLAAAARTRVRASFSTEQMVLDVMSVYDSVVVTSGEAGPR